MTLFKLEIKYSSRLKHQDFFFLFLTDPPARINLRFHSDGRLSGKFTGVKLLAVVLKIWSCLFCRDCVFDMSPVWNLPFILLTVPAFLVNVPTLARAGPLSRVMGSVAKDMSGWLSGKSHYGLWPWSLPIPMFQCTFRISGITVINSLPGPRRPFPWHGVIHSVTCSFLNSRFPGKALDVIGRRVLWFDLCLKMINYLK